MPTALSRFGTLAEFGSTLLARWPIVELASSINLPMRIVHSLLLELEIKTNKTYKSRSKIACHENLRPLEFFYFFKKMIHMVNSSPCSYHGLFYGHAMFVGNNQKDRSEIFIFSGLSLARFKIAADILIAFAGEVFTEEIEDTESLCCSN